MTRLQAREIEMKAERERVNRLKADPTNVAAQLVALTQVSDWARIAHRSNFDGYLVAAAELLDSTVSITEEDAWDRAYKALSGCTFVSQEHAEKARNQVAAAIVEALNKKVTDND